MCGNIKIPVFLKQGQKLDSKQSAFRQHTATLFDIVTEILFQFLIADHNCLSKKCSHFCSADIEYVCVGCDIRKCQIIFLAHQSIAKSRPIHEKIEPTLFAHLINCFQFRLFINRSDLCRIGNVYHFRLYHMFKTLVCKMCICVRCDLLSRQLSIRCFNTQTFMTACLQSACLMDIDMPCFCRDHSLIML